MYNVFPELHDFTSKLKENEWAVINRNIDKLAMFKEHVGKLVQVRLKKYVITEGGRAAAVWEYAPPQLIIKLRDNEDYLCILIPDAVLMPLPYLEGDDQTLSWKRPVENTENTRDLVTI